MVRNKISLCLAVILCLLFAPGCRNHIVPRPWGYFRIDFPQKAYLLYDTACPFIFEYPAYGRISYDVGKIKEPCWLNIEFPGYRATLHLSYISLHKNLEAVLNQSHEFAYSHSIKADAITELLLMNPSKKVYGILYDIKGNAASSVQFIATDSTKNFLRGALYFTAQPNEDSLAPAIRFFRDDIVHLIETLKWK
ncbi:MAG TPA: gliding motility lipoprotein GldD [Bacteroidales bacterium]|nr:gliding motility lipoprotein GldD [Bacteroidales bacterium]